MGAARQVERFVERAGDRLFEIDVLAGGDRRRGAPWPAAGRGRVEIDRDVRVGETSVAVGAPFQPALRRRQRRELLRVAAEQHRLGHEPVAIPQHEPALAADRHQRAQMLGRPEPPGRPLNDNPDIVRGHSCLRNLPQAYR